MAGTTEQAKRLLTYSDYARLPEGDRRQLFQGEWLMSPAPTPYHQRISYKLTMKIGPFVDERRLGQVFEAPTDVYFNDLNTVQPDVLFIAQSRLGIVGEKKIEAAPDLIVEILSESTAYYDLVAKKKLYESAGVKEYWIVDPMAKTIQVFALENLRYVLAHEQTEHGTIGSRILSGLTVNLEEIF